MSDADALREYTEFYAAHTVMGSTTDIRPIDVVAAAGEGGTDPIVMRPLVQQSPWSRVVLRPAKNVSPVSSHDLLLFVSGLGEASFLANKGDFAALDDLRTPQGQIRRQILNHRAGSPLIYRQRLAGRLEFLLEAMDEEGEAWEEYSPESLRRMLQFLQSVPSFRYPTVTVTPSATFRAQWTAGQNAHFALDFLPNGQVRFVVFCPDPRHPDRVKRLSGITSWESVMNDVEPFRVRRWTADARA